MVIIIVFLLLVVSPAASSISCSQENCGTFDSIPYPFRLNNSSDSASSISNGCSQEKCGTFDSIPYPFRLNNSSDCGELLADTFHLSCFNATLLFINIGSYKYQVLHFFPDGGGILVDFPNDTVRYTSSCRSYYDIKSFHFQTNGYLGISKDNVVGLYGCGDSSLCRSDCGGCHDTNTTTTFTNCLKNGVEVYGDACYSKRHGRGKLMLVAGILALALSIATLIGLYCLLKRQSKLGTVDLDQARSQSSVSFRKGCKTRLFTHSELQEATNGFSDDKKIVNMEDGGTIYSGILTDGLEVAIQKVHCTTETDLIQVLSRVKILSEVTHPNMANVLGCSIDSGCLLFGGDGRLGMNDVARELVHVTKESIDHVGSRRGPAGLEETFSNSSLLQMISLSPDSIYVP
uniref:Probably inactive receptor-like protein kinase At2g46850 n=1 Tax=Tanacetum cinerariifolium TaxID=118510 RepID=A0A6L2NC64_TANCI|nr:probably inactive receptor-like protein kinase At2g46850 [Tanacetum cinerariifolium]